MNATGQHHQFLRWTKIERWQHWLVASSFILLVLTGFALRYPESWWSRPFIGFETQFGGRGILHRLAATLYSAVALYHIFYMLLSRRGRKLLKALMMGAGDFRDVMENVSWMAGRRREPARYDHFSYAEKAEYWALVWGTVVMGVTGAGLWFEWLTLKFLPLSSIQIMTTIHLYEAWLATLAILVWHFYAVIFSPVVYPLNTSMVTGRISEHHMALEHARELEQLKDREFAEKISASTRKGSVPGAAVPDQGAS